MPKKFFHILINATLLALIALGVAAPALAFDGREGDNVVIGKDEVINDDLYVGAQTITLEGTIKGDAVLAGETITVNGTVEGDLIAAGKTIIINGAVTDDVRIAGGVLLLGENAQVGSDVIAMGASLEVRQGNTIGQDVVFFGGQTLLAGEIARNVTIGGGGVEIRGAIGGDVKADVGDAEDAGPGPMIYMPDSPIPVPNVQAGIKIDPAAKINGELEYVSRKELNFPAGVILGHITRTEPVVDPKEVTKPQTMSERIVNGALDMFRNMVTLILLGLVLVWLFPFFTQSTSERVRTAFWPSLGWGFVSWAAFFFSILVIIVAMIFGAIIFGMLTLGGISGTIVTVGLLSLFALVIGFILAAAFVSKIIVAIIGGKLILSRVRPEWAEHKVWPLVLGVVLLAILVAVPVVGWLVNFIVVLIGLGALWMYGRDLLQRGRTPATAVAPVVPPVG